MKTENFDDSFKKKIESVNPQFNEDEIERITNFVHQNLTSLKAEKNSPSKRNFLYLWVILIGLLTWNLNQYFQNKELLQSMKQINQTLSQLKLNSPPVISEITTKESPLSDQKTISEKDQITITEKQINSTTNINSNSVSQTNKYPNSLTANSNSNYTNNFNKKETFVENNLQLSNDKTDNQNKSLELIATESDIKPSDIQNKNETIGLDKTVPQNSIALKTPIDSVPIASTNINNPVKTDSSETVADIVTRNSLLNNISYKIGVGTELGNNQYGGLILGGISIKNQWSFYSGVKYSIIQSEIFDDEDDYKHKRSKSFKTTYVSDTTNTTSISRIEFKYTVYQIPLLANYNLALRKNYSILFSLGSNLDINVKKDVSYQYTNIATGQRMNKHLQLSEPNLFFNNLLLSIGLQKQIKKFGIQLAPYYSQQLKLTDYRNQKITYGFSLRLIYSL